MNVKSLVEDIELKHPSNLNSSFNELNQSRKPTRIIEKGILFLIVTIPFFVSIMMSSFENIQIELKNSTQF